MWFYRKIVRSFQDPKRRICTLSEQRDHHRNDDSGLTFSRVLTSGQVLFVLCVADGVGSRRHSGESAAWLVSSLREALLETEASDLDAFRQVAMAWARSAVNEFWERWGAENDGASTLTACLILGERYCTIHIGDTLAVWTDGLRCKCLSRIQNAAGNGDDDPSAANFLTQGFGITPDESVSVDTGEFPAVSGWLCVMSDGVHKYLVDGLGKSIPDCAEGQKSARAVAKELLDASRREGERRKASGLGPKRLDNATVAVACLGTPVACNKIALATAVAAVCVLALLLANPPRRPSSSPLPGGNSGEGARKELPENQGVPTGGFPRVELQAATPDASATNAVPVEDELRKTNNVPADLDDATAISETGEQEALPPSAPAPPVENIGKNRIVWGVAAVVGFIQACLVAVVVFHKRGAVRRRASKRASRLSPLSLNRILK